MASLNHFNDSCEGEKPVSWPGWSKSFDLVWRVRGMFNPMRRKMVTVTVTVMMVYFIWPGPELVWITRQIVVKHKT